MNQASWDLAGITPDCRVQTSALLAPHPDLIHISSGDLLWPVRSADGDGIRKVKPAKNLLLRFVKLREAKDDAIWQFAQRWGCLELCEKHGLPAVHDPGYCLPAFSQKKSQFVESLNDWRAYAQAACSIIELRAALPRTASRQAVDWENALLVSARLWGWARKMREATGKPNRFSHFSEQELATCVGDWLLATRIVPQFRWVPEDSAYRVTLGSPPQLRSTLFGHLAMCLMLTVTGTELLWMCSGCNQP